MCVVCAWMTFYRVVFVASFCWQILPSANEHNAGISGWLSVYLFNGILECMCLWTPKPIYTFMRKSRLSNVECIFHYDNCVCCCCSRVCRTWIGYSILEHTTKMWMTLIYLEIIFIHISATEVDRRKSRRSEKCKTAKWLYSMALALSILSRFVQSRFNKNRFKPSTARTKCFRFRFAMAFFIFRNVWFYRVECRNLNFYFKMNQ